MSETETVIQVEGLRMRYGSNDVLDDVGFTVGRGEVVTLLGPNGAGKTTTIEILEGFRMRSAGDVSRARRRPDRRRPRTGELAWGSCSSRGGSRPMDPASGAHPPGSLLRAVLTPGSDPPV